MNKDKNYQNKGYKSIINHQLWLGRADIFELKEETIRRADAVRSGQAKIFSHGIERRQKVKIH